MGLHRFFLNRTLACTKNGIFQVAINWDHIILFTKCGSCVMCWLGVTVCFPESPMCFCCKSHKGSHGAYVDRKDALSFGRGGISLHRLACLRGRRQGQAHALLFSPSPTSNLLTLVQREGFSFSKTSPRQSPCKRRVCRLCGLCSHHGLQLLLIIPISHPSFCCLT